MTKNLKAADALTERHITAARMLAEGDKTLNAIAKEVGVARPTLYEWRQRDDFRAIVKDFTTETVERARELLAVHAKEAVDKLVKTMRKKPGAVSLRAAEQILNRCGLSSPAESVIVQQQAQATLPDDYGEFLRWKAGQEGGPQ